MSASDSPVGVGGSMSGAARRVDLSRLRLEDAATDACDETRVAEVGVAEGAREDAAELARELVAVNSALEFA